MLSLICLLLTSCEHTKRQRALDLFKDVETSSLQGTIVDFSLNSHPEYSLKISTNSEHKIVFLSELADSIIPIRLETPKKEGSSEISRDKQWTLLI